MTFGYGGCNYYQCMAYLHMVQHNVIHNIEGSSNILYCNIQAILIITIFVKGSSNQSRQQQSGEMNKNNKNSNNNSNNRHDNYQKQHQQHQLPSSYITQRTLYILLAMLCAVWVLCYVCELRIPDRQRQELMDRLEKSVVSQKDVEQAVRLMYSGRPKSNYEQNVERVFQKQEVSIDINIEDSKNNAKIGNNNANIHQQHKSTTHIPSSQPQSSICFIITHQRQNQNWLPSLLSLISQQYNTHKIVYINNNRGSEQLIKYFQSQALHSTKDRFHYVENYTNFSFRSVLEIGREKCVGFQYVAVLEDWLILRDQFVVQRVNRVIQQTKTKNKIKKEGEGEAESNESIQLIYGGMVAIRQNNPLTAQSYAYPQQILQQKSYGNYPYVINGIVFLSYKLLTTYTCAYCIRKDGKQRPASLIKPAIFLQLLMKCSQNQVKFMDQILTISFNYQEFISPSQEGLRGEIKDLLETVKSSNNKDKDKDKK